MSSSPQIRISFPSIPLPEKVKPRRSWKRRIARGVGFTLGGLVTLVVLLLAFLQTPWGKEVVRGRIEAKLGAMVTGSVKLGAIDYSLLFGELELSNLEIRDAAGSPAIALGSLRVALDRGSLLRKAPVIDDLAIDALAVSIVKRADGRSNLTGLFKARKGKPLAFIKVAHVAVAGDISITKADGSSTSLRGIRLAGALTARPALKQLDAALHDIAAHVAIARPGKPVRELDVSIASIDLARRATGVDVEISSIAAAALGIDKVAAKIALDGRKLVGEQAVAITGLRVDDERLAALLGRELLRADAAFDLSITGPADKLAIAGGLKTGVSSLSLSGTIDAKDLARPVYDLALVGTDLRSDIVAAKKPRPLLQTSLSIQLAGAGITRADADARLAVTVGATKIGRLAFDELLIAATAKHGAFELEKLHAVAPGVSIDATAALAIDRELHGKLSVHAEPNTVVQTLTAASIPVRRIRFPLPATLDLAIDAKGRLDGELAVALAPVRVPLAGGAVSLTARAVLDHKKLARATADVTLRSLDLQQLAALAGKQPKHAGTLSGTVALTKTATTKRAAYDLAVALTKLGITVTAEGIAQPTSATAKIAALRASDRSVLATIAADLPLAKRAGKLGLARDGSLALAVDIAHRSFADIADLLPARIRAKLPAGGAELHVALSGTPAQPTGTIDLALTATKIKHHQQRVALHADVSSSAQGLAIASRTSAWLRDEATPLANIAATITTPAPFATGKPDGIDIKALRAAATIDAAIELPVRDLASLAWAKPVLAKLGGQLDGRITLRGPLAKPALDGGLRVHGLRTAAGTSADTTLSLQGTLAALTAKLDHAGLVSLDAAIDRSQPGRIAVDVTARAAAAPLAKLLPAFLAPKLGKHEPGRLDWDMTAKLALVKNATGRLALDQAAVTGTLDLAGGVLALPSSTRRWHDIQLAVVAEPTGLRIKSLTLHEQDRAKADRRLGATGFVAMNKLRPQNITLALAARDWLLSGSPTLGPHDAPRATANFDIAVAVDLTSPIIGVDATVKQLSLQMRERFDRGHAPDVASLAGDVVFVGTGTRAGKLPVAPKRALVVAPARKRRPMDIRVHIPQPIHVNAVPLDMMARGELAITVRETGTITRGTLVIERGALSVFGKDYKLVTGSIVFSDAHPKGHMEAAFERPLPPAVMRDLSLVSAGGGAKMTLSGSIAQPKKALGGASNAGLAEAMAINATGHTVYVSAPDRPASTTVVAPRGDQLSVMSFMAANLPHLMFLDRVTAYADPYRGAASYGRIENVDAERYSKDQKSRVRAVLRPPTPGRSSAELQYDRLLINDDRTAVGVGVRGGDRLGGGVGVFVEWSSKD